ncbi:UNVERIFIED_CONTAM: hypothetical protein HHA_245740 [Hammondia hammondi]|eukprot:XP_008883674.1 hypothetical protein HHA_245740 [Hammondia hammondi]
MHFCVSPFLPRLFSQPLVASSSGKPYPTFPPSSQKDFTSRLRSHVSPTCLPSPRSCILYLAALLLFFTDPSGLASHGRSSLFPSSITSSLKIVGSPVGKPPINSWTAVGQPQKLLCMLWMHRAASLTTWGSRRSRERNRKHMPSHKHASADCGYLFTHWYLCATSTDVSR